MPTTLSAVLRSASTLIRSSRPSGGTIARRHHRTSGREFTGDIPDGLKIAQPSGEDVSFLHRRMVVNSEQSARATIAGPSPLRSHKAT